MQPFMNWEQGNLISRQILPLPADYSRQEQVTQLNAVRETMLYHTAEAAVNQGRSEMNPKCVPITGLCCDCGKLTRVLTPGLPLP